MTREEWCTLVDERIALLDEHFKELDENFIDNFYAISAWSVVRQIAEGYLEIYDSLIPPNREKYTSLHGNNKNE